MATMNAAPKGLHYRTGPPLSGDRRLKVLWFEDELDIKVPQDLHGFLQVTQVRVPEVAECLLLAQRATVLRARHEPTYALPECPHDIYVADFKLDAAPRNEVDEPSLAAKARAAGLTSSVMMAVNFPLHPATVMPYTAHVEQLAEQRDLLRRLSPEYVHIQWGKELGKMSEGGSNRVLKEAVQVHRDYLPTAAERGFIHLSRQECERLRSLVTKYADAGTIWPDSTTISFETEWGTRSIFLSSFWSQLAVRGSVLSRDEADAVVKWLDLFPVPTFQEVLAAELAFTYFFRRISGKSWDRYALAARLRDGAGPSADPEVRAMCEEIGLPSMPVDNCARAVEEANKLDAQLARAKRRDEKAAVRKLSRLLRAARQKVDRLEKGVIIPADWRCPHLLKLERRLFDDETKRLAVFFLLVYEEARRWAFAGCVVESLSADHKKLIQRWLSGAPYSEGETDEVIVRLLHRVRERVRAERLEKSRASYLRRRLDSRYESLKALASELKISAETLGGMLEEATKDMLPEIVPLTVGSIARLIDPLPEQLLTADVSFGEGRVGKALSRLRPGKKGLNVQKILSCDPDQQLSAAEKLAVERFATNLSFPKAWWPPWMKWPSAPGTGTQSSRDVAEQIPAVSQG